MNSRQKQQVKKQRKSLVYVLAIILVILSWMRLTSKQTIVLQSERFTTTYDAQTFLLKNEQVFYFDQNPELLVRDGERISRQSVLFENDVTLKNYQLAQGILLQGLTQTPEREGVFNQLFEKKEEYLDLSEKEDKEPLQEECKKLVDQIQYANLEADVFENLKQKYKEKMTQPDQGKNLLQLDGQFSGYFCASTDGYEAMLAPSNMETLVDMDPEDLKETAMIIKESTNGVKVVNDDTAYLMVTLPKELLPDLKTQVKDKKEAIEQKMEKVDLKEYRNYLNRRIDILQTMPKIDFIVDQEVYGARVIAVLDSTDEKKDVLLLQLKDHMTFDFLNRRILDIQLVTYENDGYLIPKKSLLTKEGKTYIVVLNKGYLRKNLEVTVTKTEGNQIFLSRKDNEVITESMQLLVNP